MSESDLMVCMEDGVVVISATPDFHPLRQLKAVRKALRSLGFEGNILFDLLAVNGLGEQRFISSRFIDGKLTGFIVEGDGVDPGIVIRQNQRMKERPGFLAASVLSSEEQEAFLSA